MRILNDLDSDLVKNLEKDFDAYLEILYGKVVKWKSDILLQTFAIVKRSRLEENFEAQVLSNRRLTHYDKF